MQVILAPTNCPVCDSILEQVNDQIFCRNTNCQAQVFKKIEHFSKTLRISGLGPATILKLYLADFTELYYLDEDEVAVTMGAKLAAKLMNEIVISKSASFSTVLAAMSIPLVGATISNKLGEFCNSFEELNEVNCKRAGVGDKATNNIQEWLYYDYPCIKDSLPFKFEKVVAKPVNGKIVCITGKLSSFSSKKEAASALEAKGYKVTDTLNKTVNILVDEENKGSSKRIKAESYGITIVTDLSAFLL